MYNNATVTLTYEQLNAKVNQLAHYLILHYNTKPGDIIALFFERSEWQIIAILGTWKSGAAFVPIDPSFPSSRINFILHETKPKVILTTANLDSNSTESYVVNVVRIDLTLEKKDFERSNPCVNVGPRDLAYVMFTSGTTGEPKGVLVEHVALVNISYALASRYQVNPPEVILQMHNYVFDAYLEQVCLSLLQGHALLLAPPTLGDIKGLAQIIEKGKVTHLDTTPSLIGELDLKNCEKLKRVVIGGEAFTSSAFAFLSSLPQRPLVFNVYGPTEVGVTAAVHFMDSFTRKIGKPIKNTCAYVLDLQGQPVPIGAMGEIYLWSVGLARGYLNRPELTNTKFIRNPFKSDGTLFYKTGDMGKWSVDGVLEYVGRNDLQVKIRGQRVELSEIENILSSFPGVESSAVEFKKYENSSLLIGYYVASSPLNEDAMLEFMMKKLPDYMVPTHYVKLTKFPLTPSGKLDRKKLPSVHTFNALDQIMSPRNEIEKILCTIIANLLGLSISAVGANSDFFRLGGDSIISIQFVTQLRQKFGLCLSIKDIFKHRTIEKLAENVAHSKVLQEILNEQGFLSSDSFPLHPIQTLFFKSPLPSPQHLNQSFLIKINHPLEVQTLKSNMQELINFHDVFRLRFRRNESCGNYVQYYEASAGQIEPLHILDVKEGKVEESLGKWESEFDIEGGPLYTIGYLYGYPDNSTRIFFSLHHLIADMTCWNILSSDLRKICNGENIGVKGTSYRQWVDTLGKYSVLNDEEIKYWRQLMNDYEVVVEEHELKEWSTHSGCVSVTLGHFQRDSFIEVTLMSAFTLALSDLSGKRVHHIMVEGHGRDIGESYLDVSRTLGHFTSIYPIKIETKLTPASQLRWTKEMLAGIPNKGIGYGALIGYDLAQLPKIAFNYQGQFDREEKSGSWEVSMFETPEKLMYAERHEGIIIALYARVSQGSLCYEIGSRLGFEHMQNFTTNFENWLTECLLY